jgi:signal transduction histidine kinase
MNETADSALALLAGLPVPALLERDGALTALNPAAVRLLASCRELGGDGPPPGLLEGACRIPARTGTLVLPGLTGPLRRRAEQLQSFGRYTGGIVHNLNNPLNALSGMIQLMMFRNMDLPELERLDAQTDELAAQIRQLGERFRRLQEYEEGAPLTWDFVIREELRFYRADSALKHRCEQQVDLPADASCPLAYREASWHFDRLLEALLLLVPHDDLSPLRIDLPGGWPRLRLARPNLEHAPAALALLSHDLMLDLLATNGRRPVWSATPEEAVAGSAPLNS